MTIDQYLDQLLHLNTNISTASADIGSVLAAFRAEHGGDGGTTEPEPPEPGEGNVLTFSFPNHTLDSHNDIALYEAPFPEATLLGVELEFDFAPGSWRTDRPNDFHGHSQLSGGASWETNCLYWHWYTKNSDGSLQARYKAPALVGREAQVNEKLGSPKPHLSYRLERQSDGQFKGVLNGMQLIGPIKVPIVSPLVLQLGTKENKPPERECSWVGSSFSNITLKLTVE